MKRRDLFRQAMNQHLPDRKNILNTILTEAPASAPRHIGGKRALAAVLATVLLVACGTLYYFWGKPHERQPQIIESAELRLFAAGNTAVPESATELEPNIEFQMPMWGSWLDERYQRHTRRLIHAQTAAQRARHPWGEPPILYHLL